MLTVRSSRGPRSGGTEGAVTFLRPHSNQVHFVFSGGRGGVGIESLRFLKETRLLDRNVVVFRDRARAFYQRGLCHTVGSFDALLQWQREFILSRPRAPRVFCLGTSLGGFAAILAGHLLKAEHVWAFCPATVLPELPSLTDVTAERRDLETALRAHNGTTRYSIYYSESHVADRHAAERLVNCEGVTLFALPGDGHNVMGTMLKLGKLPALLPPAS